MLRVPAARAVHEEPKGRDADEGTDDYRYKARCALGRLRTHCLVRARVRVLKVRVRVRVRSDLGLGLGSGLDLGSVLGSG